jgi:hypothetical protein
MQTLGNLCCNLRHLNLEYYYPLCKDDLSALLIGLKDSLVSLKLNNIRDGHREELQLENSPFIHCTLLEELSLMRGANAEDIKAIGRLRRLKKCVIIMRYEDENININDKDFKEAFEQRQLISLQEFELRGCQLFGNNASKALLKCCPNLIHLTCCDVGLFDGLEEAVADLQKLDISACELNKNTVLSVSSLYNLRELTIDASRAPNLSGSAYRDAFHQNNLVCLKVLKLQYCENLDSEGFKAILKGSSKLQIIVLCDLPGVAGYADIFAECNLEHLETFHAFECPGFLGSDADFLKKICPNVREIIPDTPQPRAYLKKDPWVNYW